MLLVAFTTGAWADEVVVNSSQSAYVDASNSTTNYNGASDAVTSLQINNTQFRDWSSGSDGSMKFNSGGKVALYKFALSSLKSLGTISNVTFTIKGQTNDAGNKATSPVRVLGYNPTWDASTITQATLTNNGSKETLKGTVAGAGSFQPLNDTGGLTINAGETTLNVNATTYVLSAIDADNDYVTIALAVNLGRIAYLEKTAKLTVTYTNETTYDVTFSETNGVAAVVKISGTDVTSGTKLSNGSYDFIATAKGYEDYNGSFIVSGASKNVEFTLIAKEVYSYIVNATADDVILEQLVSGSNYKNDVVYYHYKQVLNNNGTLYQAPAISSGYKTSFVLDSNDKIVSHIYTQPTTPITNIVFLAEGEDLFTRGIGSSADTRCSMGAGGYASEKTSFVTLSPGRYNLVLSNRCSGDRTGIHKFYKGDDAEPFFSADGAGYNSERKFEDLILTEATTLYMQGGDNNQYVDWIYVVKTAEVATIPSSGIGTIASAYAIDCANLPSGVKAYQVTEVEGEGATLKEVKEAVAPGTGLILRGTAGVYEIPVVAEGTDISSTNELEAAVTATTLEDGKFYIMQGGQFHLVENTADEAARTVPAGKAYLPAGTNTAKSISLSFGEITDISEAEAAKATVAAEGKFIENGKLVIVKNGQKFNAAGALLK